MSPNLITGVRLVLALPLYLLLAFGGPEQRWIALALFVLAGLSDIADGWIARRFHRTSAAGAMLDLLADRLLTLAVFGGLLQSQSLMGVAGIAALVLIARDLVVATLNEALPGRLKIGASTAETMKIGLQFIGAGLLIAPMVWSIGAYVNQYELGGWCVVLSALLSLSTVADYGRRAWTAFRRDAP